MSKRPGRFVQFFAIDYRSLAAMRMLGAATMLWVLRVWAPDLGHFFTDDGVLPREMIGLVNHTGRFSILHYVDGYWAAFALWAIGVLAALSLLIGWRSRLAALVAWVVYVSFVGRNPMIAQGGDMLLPLLLFWMMFLPVGAVFSIDAALGSRNLRSEPPHLSIATVGLLLQVLYVYVIGALLKTGDAWIPNASAVYVALHVDSFVTPLGLVLRDFPLLMAGLTLFVYGIELFAPVLLFFPDRHMVVRSVSLALLMLMHLGFRIFLHIGHFWLASLTSLCAYIPSSWWRWVDARYWRRGQEKIDIYYDRDCGFCLRTALILREFFLPREVPVRPAQDFPEMGALLEAEQSWIVVTPDGRRLLHWDALVYVLRASPLLAPIGWLAALYGAIGLGRPTYDLIGRNRRSLGRVTPAMRPGAGAVRLGAPTQVFLAAVIAFGLGWNVLTVYHATRAVPAPLRTAADAVGMTQHWTMFAPSPPTVDAFPVLAARRADGGEEDAFRADGALVSFDTPDLVVSLFPTHRWRAFILRGYYEKPETRAALYARWVRMVCGWKNEGRAGGDRIKAIRIFMVRNQTKANYAEETTVEDLGETMCPAG